MAKYHKDWFTRDKSVLSNAWYVYLTFTDGDIYQVQALKENETFPMILPKSSSSSKVPHSDMNLIKKDKWHFSTITVTLTQWANLGSRDDTDTRLVVWLASPEFDIPLEADARSSIRADHLMARNADTTVECACGSISVQDLDIVADRGDVGAIPSYEVGTQQARASLVIGYAGNALPNLRIRAVWVAWIIGDSKQHANPY